MAPYAVLKIAVGSPKPNPQALCHPRLLYWVCVEPKILVKNHTCPATRRNQELYRGGSRFLVRRPTPSANADDSVCSAVHDGARSGTFMDYSLMVRVRNFIGDTAQP
jgi:hypothetical protein